MTHPRDKDDKLLTALETTDESAADRLLHDISRSYSEESYLIYQSSVKKRYSALVKAMQADAEAKGGDDIMEHSPDYEAMCMKLLDLPPGDETYIVHRRFSSGGMGSLHFVYDRRLQRRCVVKVILSDLRKNDMALKSFVREARITGQLEHPNIIPVHDLGFLPDYGLFFSMKLIEGVTLNDILLELEMGNPEYAKKYDAFALLNIFRKVCDAVAFAHSRGIIHRDIKPRNIMVGDYGEVLLMDWGLAKNVPRRLPTNRARIEEESIGADTSFSVIKGSPGYMSPEQARGLSKMLDQRSDIFLLGATLYNMFTFFPPYMGESLDDVLGQARKCDYMSPQELRPEQLHVPADLYRIVHKAMAKRPENRYQTVAELIKELDDVIHGRMHFKRRIFKKGEYLVREGEEGTESYIIEEGEVEVFMTHHSKRVALGRFGEGEIVGEMSVITHQPRTASVQALEKTRAMILTRESFEQNLKKLPPWLENTVVALASRLTDADRKLAENG